MKYNTYMEIQEKCDDIFGIYLLYLVVKTKFPQSVSKHVQTYFDIKKI